MTTYDIDPLKVSRVLLLGSSGFIGQRVAEKLQTLGYQLRCPRRDQVDFMTPDWQGIAKLVDGVDMIINMVGIMSQQSALLEQVHHHAPVHIAALGKKCGVKRWINLSALGADASHEVGFVGSKGRGDDALLDLADDSFSVYIARPSLVFGRGGASCELFIKLAKLPVILLPNKGSAYIQPVHVDDVAEGLVKLAVDEGLALPKIINFTGGKVGTLADYLSMIRREIHQLPTAKILGISSQLAKGFALLAQPFSQGMINSDSLTLLAQGSIAEHEDFSQLLGREPLGFDEFARDKFHVKL